MEAPGRDPCTPRLVPRNPKRLGSVRAQSCWVSLISLFVRQGLVFLEFLDTVSATRKDEIVYFSLAILLALVLGGFF